MTHSFALEKLKEKWKNLLGRWDCSLASVQLPGTEIFLESVDIKGFLKKMLLLVFNFWLSGKSIILWKNKAPDMIWSQMSAVFVRWPTGSVDMHLRRLKNIHFECCKIMSFPLYFNTLLKFMLFKLIILFNFSLMTENDPIGNGFWNVSPSLPIVNYSPCGLILEMSVVYLL